VEALLTAISKTLAPATAMTQPGRLAGKTVLCADDDNSQLTARRMMLETAGVKVLLAHNGAEALDIFRTAPVDAAVVDYYMPGKNGLSIGAEMKRLRPDVPVIVLSGFASLPGETVGLVDAWLQKRDVELLLRELEKAVEQRRDRHPSV
jgi:CheY-like chemotaxis protein